MSGTEVRCGELAPATVLGPFSWRENLESYKHKFAKNVMLDWFRSFGIDGGGLPPFSWRPNRPEPHFGAWEEYPFCLDQDNTVVGNAPVWDEVGHGWFEEKEYLHGKEGAWLEKPPTYDECVSLGLCPIVVFDIALQHKGSIIYGIEIVHKHDISNIKLDYLKRIGIPTFRVEADWILSQCARPEKIKCIRVI